MDARIGADLHSTVDDSTPRVCGQRARQTPESPMPTYLYVAWHVSAVNKTCVGQKHGRGKEMTHLVDCVWPSVTDRGCFLAHDDGSRRRLGVVGLIGCRGESWGSVARLWRRGSGSCLGWECWKGGLGKDNATTMVGWKPEQSCSAYAHAHPVWWWLSLSTRWASTRGVEAALGGYRREQILTPRRYTWHGVWPSGISPGGLQS